ncbi:MAG: Uma2 family endonuclease [Planctomycetes bacterium]|nr:Uma2 family endonuclease [Planctomycetota bacterium]
MATSPHIERLHQGDNLTRAEFERRYERMPDVKKAELVEGMVFMPSPVRLDQHGLPHALLAGWLRDYVRGTPGFEVAIDTTLRLDGDNEFQPDLMLFTFPPRGRLQVAPDGYLEGAPELVVEVAASSVSYDLHQKKNVYRRAGVPEYLVLRTVDRAVDWFVLRDEIYEPMVIDAAGLLRSEVLPGLWLDAAALLRGEDAGLLRAAQAGLVGAEHAAFVARRAASAPRDPS